MGENGDARVQVLMSTYNAGKYLEEQMNTILAQKGCKIDILVRDDMSSDDTVNKLKAYKGKYKNIDLILGQKNLGPARSYMTLIQQSGEYDFYAFADQDDIWDIEKIQKAIRELDNLGNVPALYCSNARIINSEGNQIGERVYKNQNKATDLYSVASVGNFMGCGMVFNKRLRDIVMSRGIPQFIIMHDSYIASVCVSVGGRFIYDCLPNFSYRLHNQNSVGISMGRFNSIKRALKSIFSKREVSVSQQDKDILEFFPVTKEARQFLLEVSNYELNIIKRITLTIDRRINFDSFHSDILTRLRILLGNL